MRETVETQESTAMPIAVPSHVSLFLCNEQKKLFDTFERNQVEQSCKLPICIVFFKVLQVLLSAAVPPKGKSDEQSSPNKYVATNLLLE